MTFPPEDLSPTRRARLERALADRERAFIEADDPGPPMFVVGGGVAAGKFRGLPAARVPEQYVIDVFATAVQVCCEEAHEHTWTADRLRSVTDSALTWLITHVYTQKHFHKRAVTLEDFTTRVHQQLNPAPCWSDLQVVIRELAETEPSCPPAVSSIQTFPKRATWFAAMLAQRKVTPHRFSVQIGADHRTVKKVLAAEWVQDAILEQIAHELGCPVRDIPEN